jgi:hypothetical protein
MIHKAMEELYVFVSSDDSVEHFGYNSGGQFRAQFPRTYPMKDMGVCVIERFFCTGVRNTHQKGLGMRGFHGKLFVRKKLVPTGSPFLRRTTTKKSLTNWALHVGVLPSPVTSSYKLLSLLRKWSRQKT